MLCAIVNVKKLRYLLETTAVEVGARILPSLSRPTILGIAHVLGFVAYVFDYKGRATAHENLAAAFASDGISAPQVRRIALASYQTFALTFVDLFCSLNLKADDYQKLIHIIFEDPTVEAMARERGALWVTPHFGNFELVGLAMGFRGFAFTVIAQDFKNEALTHIFTRLRQGSGHNIISQQGAMLRVMKELKRKGHAALLTDLNIKPEGIATVIECFGLKTCVTTLHTSLAKRLSLPIIPGLSRPMSDGTYQLFLHAAMEAKDYASPAVMAQAVWDIYEKRIRETPEAWLWMYKHWRYLPANADPQTYPSYANRHKHFEALLQREKNS